MTSELDQIIKIKQELEKVTQNETPVRQLAS